MIEGQAVTRSATAQTPYTAAKVARQRVAKPNGWWGMALFMCSEATIFGTLLATYFYLDFGSTKWPPPGIKPPEVLHPLLATGWLVATSIPMWLAARRARAGGRVSAGWLLALAMVMQCIYLAAQIILFRHDLLQFSPQGSAYGSIYFTILGVHHAHVLLGILIDFTVLWHLITRGLNNYWLIGVRGSALYWHVVNALAVLVVFTQLTPSL
jgi:heme/copper-type cytochrome/quinol oxidase subunit 3